MKKSKVEIRGLFYSFISSYIVNMLSGVCPEKSFLYALENIEDEVDIDKNIKIKLLTGTPIFKVIDDLERIFNPFEVTMTKFITRVSIESPHSLNSIGKIVTKIVSVMYDCIRYEETKLKIMKYRVKAIITIISFVSGMIVNVLPHIIALLIHGAVIDPVVNTLLTISLVANLTVSSFIISIIVMNEKPEVDSIISISSFILAYIIAKSIFRLA
ncbi:MAG: hypothetical protein QXP91_02915 [Candidatus Methanomethylicia archaeon]